MWIAAIFDLPVSSAEDRKNYRMLRKKLLSSGFVAVQKSLLGRWVENKEFADTVVRKLEKFVPLSGNVIFFYIPDVSFVNTLQLCNGNKISPPSPPEPWRIFT